LTETIEQSRNELQRPGTPQDLGWSTDNVVTCTENREWGLQPEVCWQN